ncbi:mechanosensitive ion channel family protein [Psychromonas sp. MME2]|uniref:mechanosensitive ion channel family protein n=1 Tax=unclassified Psychromonas TaxID=2614957 RepID=UPI00339CACA1
MKNSHFYLILTLFFCSFSLFAEDSDLFYETQSSLSLQLAEIERADDADKSFLEDVLRRKNSAFREQIAPLVKTELHDQQLNKIVMMQLKLLEALLSQGHHQLTDLMKKSRQVSGDDRLEYILQAQKRSNTMDIDYQQLAQTLQWADLRKMEVVDDAKMMHDELVKRADFLTNTILYIRSQQEYIERRLKLVSQEDAAELHLDMARYRERIGMLVVSLSKSVELMGALDIDSTEYKQLLLSVTGDINADVLDYDVALGIFDEWVTNFKAWLFDNSPSIVVKSFIFVFILYIAHLFSKTLKKIVRKSIVHSKMDISVLMQDFFSSIISKMIMFIGLLVALSQLGIELAPLLTGFGVAGLIIGFALQDTLSNFASGLMILIYRPYDVGDMVKVAGFQGIVKNMSLVSTTIQTVDNQRLIIPNNKIWGDVINNITVEKVRRIDLVFGIGYSDDIDKAKKVLTEILTEHEKVLDTPAAVVKLHTLNTSSVDFVVRPWVKTDDYWNVYWDITESVKKRFDQENISIPFPQQDVHLYKHEISEL